jgi:formamidopyrimidine-DNA glycosylase
MPEMPEVEFMTRNLRRWIPAGTVINGVEVLRAPSRYLQGDADRLVGSKVVAIKRVGKVILIELETPEGEILTVHSHQAMSGLWTFEHDPWTFDYVEIRRKPDDMRHVRVILDTSVGKLYYNDQRVFGRIALGANHPAGEEVLSSECSERDELTPEAFVELVRSNPRVYAKTLICDQRKMLGVGNIYSAEALWRAKISPTRECRDVTDDEARLLLSCIRDVMNEALDRELDYSGLKVYRAKECTCGARIVKKEVDGRGAYHCAICQT